MNQASYFPLQVKPYQPDVDPDTQIIQTLGEKPDNISVHFLLEERERRIKSRISYRLEELLSLTSTPSFEESLSVELKRKAEIEWKQLKLLDIQKKLRSQVADRLRKVIELESSADSINAYKKGIVTPSRSSYLGSATTTTGKATPRYALLESATYHQILSSHSKLDQEQLKHKRQTEFLLSVAKQCKDFKDFHLNKQKRQKKIAKDILAWHSNEERRKQQEEERRQRARLQALRDNNEEEYLKYLAQTKNDRLSQLLKQTDDYLESIGAMLQVQKDRDEIEETKAAKEKLKKAKEKAKKKAAEGEQPLEGEGGEEMLKESTDATVGRGAEDSAAIAQEKSSIEKNKKYYTIAHSIQEQITEQPEMLASGKLKSYQVRIITSSSYISDINHTRRVVS